MPGSAGQLRRPDARVVICCLAREVFSRIGGALMEQGFQGVQASPTDTQTMTPRRHVVGIIYDIGPTGIEGDVDIIHRLWSLYPGRPVLLYYLPSITTASVVGRLARLPGVVAWARVSNPTEEAHQLGKLVCELFARTPGLLVRTLLNDVCPKVPPAPFMILDALLDRLEGGGEGAPIVSELAQRVGFRLWQVRRACRMAALPAPQVLVEWVTLIYVITLADWEDQSIARAAGDIGVTEKYIRALRARLLPEIARLSGQMAHGVLPHAMAKFAETCGLPSERATSVAERLLT